MDLESSFAARRLPVRQPFTRARRVPPLPPDPYPSLSDLSAHGSLSKQRVVYDFGKGRGGDGLRVDVNGNLWVAAGLNRSRGNPGESLDVPTGV
jgi:hypothetical protein